MTTTKAPQLLQLQIQEQRIRSTPLKVRLPVDVLAALQRIQAEIGRDPKLPAPSIHAMILKAVRNYIGEFESRSDNR